MSDELVGDFTVSAAVIAVTALVWLVWDIIAYAKGKKTISHHIVKWSYYSPMIPFIMGMLMGHWFWT